MFVVVLMPYEGCWYESSAKVCSVDHIFIVIVIIGFVWWDQNVKWKIQAGCNIFSLWLAFIWNSASRLHQFSTVKMSNFGKQKPAKPKHTYLPSIRHCGMRVWTSSWKCLHYLHHFIFECCIRKSLPSPSLSLVADACPDNADTLSALSCVIFVYYLYICIIFV